MILLFTTRKVDKNDERAGFVTGWLEQLSKHLTKLIVICQEKGDVSDLPANVEVYSLGKENGFNKLKQIINLIILFNKNIKKTDGIFCHMVPHFAIVAGPWAKIYHKKIVQWYVHKTVSPWLKMANIFVDEYVTTNLESFQLKTKKIIHYFGHGINVNKFKPSSVFPAGLALNQANKAEILYFKILSVSRISPSKNVDLIIKAVENVLQINPELKNKIQLNIVGAPGLKEQQAYYNSLINYVEENNLKNNIYFFGPLSPDKTLSYYQNCDLFINLSDTGSVDKAVLEAMAVEKIVLTSNVAFKNVLPEKLYLTNKNPEYIADKILEIYNLPSEEKENLSKKLRQEVVENHNLEKLINKIIKLYE